MLAARSRVHVVIVNYNRWHDTLECLESVLRSDHEDLHVIVVDNASSDDSTARISAWASGAEPYTPPRTGPLTGLSLPPVQKPVELAVLGERDGYSQWVTCESALPPLTIIVAADNHGFAGGNNLAIRLLLDRGDSGYVCLINNDMVIAPDAIRMLWTVAEQHPSVAAVGGVILDYQQPDLVQMIGGGRMSRLGMSEAFGSGGSRHALAPPGALGYVTGGLLLTRLETVRAIGPLDERFFLYAEDADWGERMRRAGGSLVCTLQAFVWHKGTLTIGAGSPFQDYHVVRSSLQFVRKHAVVLLPVALVYFPLRFLLPKLVRRQWRRAGAVSRGIRDALRNA